MAQQSYKTYTEYDHYVYEVHLSAQLLAFLIFNHSVYCYSDKNVHAVNKQGYFHS